MLASILSIKKYYDELVYKNQAKSAYYDWLIMIEFIVQLTDQLIMWTSHEQDTNNAILTTGHLTNTFTIGYSEQ